MARIDHSSHNHPNTPAARKTCRDEIREAAARIDGTKPLGPDPRLAVVVPPIEKEIARSRANQAARRQAFIDNLRGKASIQLHVKCV